MSFIINPFAFSAAGGDPAPIAGGPAIYHVTGWGSYVLPENTGQRFTVGANPITVTGLRFYHGSGDTETVYLYRQSDGVLLASASVTSPGGWAEEAITPVELAAGTDYVVSSHKGGSSRAVYRNPSAYLVDPGITRVGGVFGSTTAMPSSSSANTYVHAAFSTAAPASGYRFYRLNVTANNGRSTINVAALELRASVGGADEAGSGVAYATSVFSSAGSEAAKAFDADSATFWSSATGVTAAELWYDFGTAAEIAVAQYAIRARSNANNGTPRDWTFEGSNDLETWTVLDTVSGETGWANGELRAFTL